MTTAHANQSVLESETHQGLTLQEEAKALTVVDDVTATAARLNGPESVTVSASGDLYVADRGNNVIRRFAVGGTISTIAGTGTAGYSGDGGAATAARLNAPAGIAVDSTGVIYIADTANQRIRKVSCLLSVVGWVETRV